MFGKGYSAKYVVLLLVSFFHVTFAKDVLLDALKIAESGALLQAERMKIVSENIANADTISSKKGSSYCRRVVVVKVRKGKVRYVVRKSFKAPFVKKYDPSHPYADALGYVYVSNVNKDIERADAAEAQVSYEANLKVIKALGYMTTNTIELVK